MTTIINADTSGGLKLTSDTSGALDIQSAGSTKLAMDSSGNVTIVGNTIAPNLQGPYFMARAATGTSVSSATWTKITYDDEIVDTHGKFASSRFTPTVAGYYIFCFTVGEAGTTDTRIQNAGLYINGSIVSNRQQYWPTSTYPVTGATVTYYLDADDYAEVYMYINQAVTTGTGVEIAFSGCLLRI